VFSVHPFALNEYPQLEGLQQHEDVEIYEKSYQIILSYFEEEEEQEDGARNVVL
jgi:hypothetical protein